MKKLLFFLITVVGFTTMSVAQQYTAIPDKAFESKLMELGIDKDGLNGFILTSSIDTITTLDVSYNNGMIIDSAGFLVKRTIKSLVGIEYFTALTKLYCSSNKLISLDVSKNTALTDLNCNDNQLISLDVNKNTALKNLWCQGNQLTSLDLSKSTVTQLYCDNNKLTSLIFNEILFNIYCQFNQLASLDVSKLSDLQYLHCSYNQITSLDVSKNTKLSVLNCQFNKLTSLDLSGIDFWVLRCHDNQLTNLNITDRHSFTNGFGGMYSKEMKSGGGWLLDYDVNCVNNPNLKFICVDKIFDASVCPTFYKDSTALFSETCINGFPVQGQSNHVITVPASLASSIKGKPLAIGDFIGVFFANGTQCGAYQKWNGQGTTLTAFSNTNGTTQNGFNTGEQFIIKVWNVNDAKEYIMKEVKAVYETTSPYVPGNYLSNAMSKILFITTDTCTVQNLNLYKGWNLVSLFVAPKDVSMSAVFAGVSPVLIKNALGTVLYAPQNGITGGTWNQSEGYLVFSTKTDNVFVCGTKINPSTTIAIPNNPYPYFLPYLLPTENDVKNVMASVENDIQYVQSMEYTPNANAIQAYNYVPTHIINPTINQIGNMKPGLGYKVMTQASIPSFSYSALNTTASTRMEDQTVEVSKQVSQHFGIANATTGSNAVVVIPDNMFSPALQTGDEIGVFAPDGTLAGSGVSIGSNMAITVWENTSMKEGNSLSFKIWRKDQNQEKAVSVPFTGNGGNYNTNSLQVANARPTGLAENGNSSANNDFLCYPNPTSQAIVFQIPATLETADMLIFNSLGILMEEQKNANFSSGQLIFNCDNLENGLYYVSIKSKGTEMKTKFVVSK